MGKLIYNRYAADYDDSYDDYEEGDSDGEVGFTMDPVTTVIDTNVFLGAGDEVFRKLSNRDIIIPIAVLQELERKRTSDGGLGYAARGVIRFIEDVRMNAMDNICKFPAPCGNGNTLRIEINHKNQSILPHDFQDPKSVDREILAVSKNLQEEEKKVKSKTAVATDENTRVQLLTNDVPLRLLASCIDGIDPEPYEDPEGDARFTGRIVIDLDDDEFDYSGLEIGHIEDEELDDIINDMDYHRVPYHAIVEVRQEGMVDQFLKNGSIYTQLGSACHIPRIGAIRPKGMDKNNYEQAVAMSWLQDPSVQIVSLGGVAGAGKTFLAVSEGLNEVADGNSPIEKVTVFRSMYAVGRQEQGFLKGDADDKMRPWAQAVWDDVRKYDQLNGKGRSDKGRANQDSRVVMPDGKVRTGLESDYADKISVEPITYLRGRTLENQFVIVDDAQSLDRSIILDVISRLGDGSKIVFTFDMDQQDNPYLSRGTSIESLIQRLKDDSRFAHMDFRHSERSELAQLASQLLSEFAE